MDNNNADRRCPLHDPSRVRTRDCKLWTAEETTATLANVTKVRCKCRNCRGQTWVSRRTAAKHMKSIGRHPRLRANMEVRIWTLVLPHLVHACLYVIDIWYGALSQCVFCRDLMRIRLLRSGC